MNFISALALILLTLVGYSSGNVLAARGRKVSPGLLDNVIVAVLWLGALLTRDFLGRWMAILVWLLVGIFVGAVVVSLRRQNLPVEDTREPEPLSDKTFRIIWGRWKAFAVKMGDYQSRIMLIWFYYLVVTPFGLLVRIFRDPLMVQEKSGSSFWLLRPSADTDLDEARKQY